MNGPIVKDATYFSFWSAVMLVWLSMQVCQIVLLASILREVRR